MASIYLQSSTSWLSQATRQGLYQGTNHCQLQLVSREGLTTNVPVSVIMAFSPFLQSILPPSCLSCEMFNSPMIFLPSASDFTLKLLAQILQTGETELCSGLGTTMQCFKQLQEVFVTLGAIIKIGPKLCMNEMRDNSALTPKVDIKCEKMNDHVKREDVTRAVNTLTNQNVMKTDRKNSSSNVKFKQSGLLKNFKVNLVRRLGSLSDKDTIELETKKLDNECTNCSQHFVSLTCLTRHYREKHGYDGPTKHFEQDYRNAAKQSEIKCPKCRSKFKARNNMLQHFRVKHGHIVTNKDNQDISDAKEFTAKKCTGNQDTFIRIKCSDCDKTFSNQNDLSRHMESVHE